MRSLDPNDFVEQLRNPAKRDELFIVGMAKPSDGKKDSFLLGPTHKCGPWAEIPIKSVARIVPLMNGSCGSHEHPIVAVYFREKKDATTRALVRLMRTMQDDLLADLVCNGVTTMSRSQAGGGGDGTGQVICMCIPMPICWELDWTLDYPPGTPPPAAHPTPKYDCIVIPLIFCRRIPA